MALDRKLRARIRAARNAVLAAAICVSPIGCGLTWDDVTSREFKVSQLWTPPPPPMDVIQKSSDGYARAKAINRLSEPRDPSEAANNIRVLQATATTDHDPLCRLAALRTLGRYKDPQAARVLADVYLGNPKFSPEYNALIRQQALMSLENSSPPEVRQLFIQAAKQPAGSLTQSAQRDRMEILDERLSAIHALGKYPDPDARETLVHLLETEKDVAIRTCATESLKASTQKDIPANAKMWREYLATGKEPPRDNTLLAGLKLPGTSPLPPPPPNRDGTPAPGFFDKMTDIFRVDQPETPQQPLVPPARFPQAVPSQPIPPNETRRSVPVSTPGTVPTATPIPTTVPTSMNTPRPSGNSPANATNGVVPTGSYRNSSNELVVPAQQ